MLVVLIMCRKTFNSTQNQVVLTKLIKEVKGLNPSMEGADIRSEFCVEYCICIGLILGLRVSRSHWLTYLDYSYTALLLRIRTHCREAIVSWEVKNILVYCFIEVSFVRTCLLREVP